MLVIVVNMKIKILTLGGLNNQTNIRWLGIMVINVINLKVNALNDIIEL